MTRLSDTQRIILAAAAQRADASLLPLAPNITPGGGGAKALKTLLSRGYAEERETSGAAVHREEGDQRYGLFLTAAGAAAIGIEPEDGAPGTTASEEVTTPPEQNISASDAAAKPASKAAQVLGLLTRTEGATLAELITLTGWLPHTIRAALTGLRKKGHAISRGQRDGVTCYRIASVA